MTVTVEDVQKILSLVKEGIAFGLVFAPEGKFKEWLSKGQEVVSTPALSALVVDSFKLYDEVKAIIVK